MTAKLLVGLASTVILRFESLMNMFYCLTFETSPTQRTRSLRNRMVQSKVKVTLRRMVSQSVYIVHAALEGLQPNKFQFDIRRGTLRRNLLLPLGRLHVKHAVQREIWVPTQHLLWDQGKARKTSIKPIWTFGIQLWGTSSTSNITDFGTFPVDDLAHDSARTFVRAEYGYPKGSPNTNS
jgi:hypothetical protein